MFYVVFCSQFAYSVVGFSGLITSVGEERAGFSVQKEFPLPLGAYDRLRYLIVTLPVPSI